MARPKLIEDPDGMVFEYIDEEEAEFLYEVRNYVTFDSRAKCIAAQQSSMSPINKRISVSQQQSVQ